MNLRRLSLSLLATLGLPILAAAQLQNGNIFGLVRYEDGQPLAGVQLSLAGQGLSRSVSSDEQGRFRFVSLPPGTYSIEANLQGLSNVVSDNVTVQVGQNTSLELAMMPEIQEVVSVAAEAPLLDPRRVATGETLSAEDLLAIPSSRSMWDTIRQTPGVLIDRVNIAGAENAQQSTVAGPGTVMQQNAWSIDGVLVSEPNTSGSSAVFFDLEAVEEVQITTGGSDIALATGGVSTNLVTRRGTDQWRGSGRFLTSRESWQSDFRFDSGDLATAGPWNLGNAQESTAQTNRIDTVQEIGFEVGGQLIRDRLWLWLGWSDQTIDVFTLGDFREDSSIEIPTLKLNADLTASSSLMLFYMDSDRFNDGRNVGPLFPPPTSWQFSSKADVLKLQLLQQVGSSMYFDLALSTVDEALTAEAKGGRDVNAVLGPTGVWQNSFISGGSELPQESVRFDGRYFLGGGAAQHELRFGASYRQAETHSSSAWPGIGGVIGIGTTIPVLGLPLGTATVGGNSRADREIGSLWFQDTISLDRLTLSLGLRYDLQDGSNLASTQQPNELFPDLLPGRTFPGADTPFDWTLLAPRLGVTWAFGERRENLLRASYARSGYELSLADILHSNPTKEQSATFLWFDNGDLEFDPSEIGPVIALNTETTNRTDPGFDTPVVDEILLGAERMFGPHLAAGITLRWRQTSDTIHQDRVIFDESHPPGTAGRAATRADYERALDLNGVLPDGQGYSVPVYRLRDGRTWLGGTLLGNGVREQDYVGFSLHVDKRLANRWRLLGFLELGDWTWTVPRDSIVDPTPNLLGDDVDGGAVVQDTTSLGDLKPAVYLNTRWAFNVSALYEVAPEKVWGFRIGADLYGRTGYPIPYFQFVSAAQTGDGIDRDVRVAAEIDDARNEDVLNLSARLDKEVPIGNWGVLFSLEAFNLLNESTVLQRQNQLGIATGDYVIEVVNPRTYRLGLRLRFR